MNIYIFLKLLKQYDSLINLLHKEDIYRNADVSFVIIFIPQAVVPQKKNYLRIFQLATLFLFKMLFFFKKNMQEISRNWSQ